MFVFVCLFVFVVGGGFVLQYLNHQNSAPLPFLLRYSPYFGVLEPNTQYLRGLPVFIYF